MTEKEIKAFKKMYIVCCNTIGAYQEFEKMAKDIGCSEAFPGLEDCKRTRDEAIKLADEVFEEGGISRWP